MRCTGNEMSNHVGEEDTKKNIRVAKKDTPRVGIRAARRMCRYFVGKHHWQSIAVQAACLSTGSSGVSTDGGSQVCKTGRDNYQSNASVAFLLQPSVYDNAALLLFWMYFKKVFNWNVFLQFCGCSISIIGLVEYVPLIHGFPQAFHNWANVLRHRFHVLLKKGLSAHLELPLNLNISHVSKFTKHLTAISILVIWAKGVEKCEAQRKEFNTNKEILDRR